MTDNQQKPQNDREGSRREGNRPRSNGKPGGSYGARKGGGKPRFEGKGGAQGARKGGSSSGQWKKEDGKPHGQGAKKSYGKPGGGEGRSCDKPRGEGEGRSYGKSGGSSYGKKPYGKKSGSSFDKKGSARKDFRDDGKPRFGEKGEARRFEGKGSGQRDFRKGGKDGFKKPRRDGAPSSSWDKAPRKDDARQGFAKDGERRERKDFRDDKRSERRDFRKDSHRDGGGEGRKDFRRDNERRDFGKDEVVQRSSDTKQRGFRPVQQRTPRIEDLEKEPRLYAGRPEEAEAAEAAEANAPSDQLRESKATPARLVALQVGRQARERDAFVHDLLEARFAEVKMTREDRAFASLLSLGVAQTRGTLDEVINRAVASPDDIKPRLRDALRVSTYEIIYLDKASHAAVDQGVELARAAARNADKLANAVLHRIVTMREQFPFGDPKTDLAAFARLHAFPAWLADLLVRDLGMDAARDLMTASNDQAPLFVAVNSLRSTDEEVAELLTAAGATVTPVELGGVAVPGCLRVSDGHALLDGRVRYAIKQGKFLVSDAAAQAVAQLVLDNRPSSLLEVGAGRATKTILLQSGAQRRFGRQLTLTTIDNRAFKTKLLKERASAYGARVDGALVGDATDLDAVVGQRTFDAVFIDAPCSGLGTLRRHPEIRWRLEPGSVERFAQTGGQLLRSAASHVAPGGTLIYATCTVTRAENNDVVAEFLKSPEGQEFSLKPVAGRSCFATRVAPGSSDAHFAVCLVRNK